MKLHQISIDYYIINQDSSHNFHGIGVSLYRAVYSLYKRDGC